MKLTGETQIDNPWPRRLAVLLVCATFPLIWVGGLVTTTDAGMAFDDWPTTDGYVMFLYPVREWLFGSWDAMVEHGHRLLGMLAGIITIALAVAVWLCDRRVWMRWLSLAALALVIFQGVLGGFRVIQDQRQLALLHGCVGPAFFALAVTMAVFTSRLWKRPDTQAHSQARLIHSFALLTVALSYAQLIIGAHMRHVPVDASPSSFRMLVIFHLFMAFIVAFHILSLVGIVIFCRHGKFSLSRPAWFLGGLLLLQLALGCATWVVKYAWPDWFSNFAFAARYTVVADSMSQTLIVTAHVATGSLILAAGTQLALRSLRLLHPEGTGSQSMLKGAVA